MFPTYNGETLSWSIGLYFTEAERKIDYPRMRAVIRAMLILRPNELYQERHEMLRASFGMFGQNAMDCLRVINQEIAEHKA